MYNDAKAKRMTPYEAFETDVRNDKQEKYLRAKSIQDLVQWAWSILLASLVLVVWFSGATRDNHAMLFRLGHQVRSTDEAFEKYVESSPKAASICREEQDHVSLKDFFAKLFCLP
ncbi:hypothetical protein BKA67DRAFT_537241 [Truncatella angustata]|uniref:Uncharacterized protein n=1 Tax=Truncatella angustata TaxID=152316 RepID=A0A9P8UK24_9PEZI|nr:uncharacterized protein BKA67DRAFT_537241 [Truncatella angustata]KAH6653604.1 hypothetical protein BKA67DRAFT_537241 [Truncatella angustata]